MIELKIRVCFSSMDSVGAYMRHVPFDHFARKNIGYLYAIAHGAEFIFDFDDDNSLKTSEVDIIPWTDATWRVRQIVASPLLFNVYPLMHPTVDGTWPGGLLLELVKNTGQRHHRESDPRTRGGFQDWRDTVHGRPRSGRGCSVSNDSEHSV